MKRALEMLPEARRELVGDLVAELSAVRGVVAIVLGGSWARGDALPGSDVDLGLYYRESDPFDVESVRAIARSFDSSGDPVVSGFYEWGRWVNGGAWLHTRVGKVDLLYRGLEHVVRVIDAAERGEHEAHFAQQPPYGYFSVTALAETACCVALADTAGAIAALKERVAIYPPALRRALVQSSLWSTEFTLYAARDLASRGDVYGTTGCLTRAASALVQALFALNETLFASDKTALDRIAAFSQRPDRFPERLAAILARPGTTALELSLAVRAIESLFAECAALAGDLYQSRYTL